MKRIAAVVEGACIVGLKHDRLVVARDRIVELLQLLKRIAAIVEAARIVSCEGDCLVIARHCLVEPFQLLERNAADPIGSGNLWIYF